jgi:hypothetical protein
MHPVFEVENGCIFFAHDFFICAKQNSSKGILEIKNQIPKRKLKADVSIDLHVC